MFSYLKNVIFGDVELEEEGPVRKSQRSNTADIHKIPAGLQDPKVTKHQGVRHLSQVAGHESESHLNNESDCNCKYSSTYGCWLSSDWDTESSIAFTELEHTEQPGHQTTSCPSICQNYEYKSIALKDPQLLSKPVRDRQLAEAGIKDHKRSANNPAVPVHFTHWQPDHSGSSSTFGKRHWVLERRQDSNDPAK